MLLTAIGGLCWQVKEMMSLLKEGKLTLFLGGAHLPAWAIQGGWGDVNTSGVLGELGSV